MTEVDTQGLTDLQQEIVRAQSQVPSDSLDWNIYEAQLDLLNRVSVLIGSVALSKKTVDQQRFREFIAKQGK